MAAAAAAAVAAVASSKRQLNSPKEALPHRVKQQSLKPKSKPKLSHESPLLKRKVGQAAARTLLLSEHSVDLFKISEYAKTASCLRAFTEKHIKLYS